MIHKEMMNTALHPYFLCTKFFNHSVDRRKNNNNNKHISQKMRMETKNSDGMHSMRSQRDEGRALHNSFVNNKYYTNHFISDNKYGEPVASGELGR